MAHQIRAGWAVPDAAYNAAARNEPGALDRQWTFDKALTVDSDWSSLIIKNLNVQPFTPSPDNPTAPGRLNIPAASCHFQLIRNYHLHSRLDDETKSDAIKLAELMGPNIPNHLCLAQEKARDKFKNIVINTLYELPAIPGVSPVSRKLPTFWTLNQDSYDVIRTTDDFHGRNLTRKGLPLQFPAPVAELMNLTVEQIGQLWYVMCTQITETYGVPWIKEQLLNLVVHILVGTVKQGNCTPEFARKINNGMMQDFGQEVNLMPEVLSMWYQRCSSGIDDTNIRSILGRNEADPYNCPGTRNWSDHVYNHR